jgi:DNA-binding GntR family transcriptional regulator
MELKKSVGNKVSIAFSILHEKIINGFFEYGEVLSANALSSELQMSRTPILEAFKLLEREDMVTVIPQIGVIVKPLNVDDIHGRYEALAALEGLLAGDAAEKCTPSDVDHLMEYIIQMEKNINNENNNGVLEINILFHETIREMANKPYVQTLCNQLRKSQRWHSNLKDIVYNEQNNLQSFNEHKECFQAIKKNDVLNARFLMEKHVLRTRKQVLASFEMRGKS